jgi:hypothetical protein
MFILSRNVNKISQNETITRGLYYKNTLIVNDTSRVVRMRIVSEHSWSISYSRQLRS